MNNIKNSQDVYKDLGESVIFSTLKLNRKSHEDELNAISKLADRLPSFINSLRIRVPEDNLNVSFGFSNNAWIYLFGKEAKKPKELETFTGLKNKHEMPGTDDDLFFHIRANSQAPVFELMNDIMTILSPFVSVSDETHGFRYFEGRAIIGFIDGTEAPNKNDAVDYALIGDEDVDFIDGSYAFGQKWIHNMKNWENKTAEDQEKSIGRHKFSDIELEEDEKYSNAHNVASKIEINGVEQKIVRMNVPFSNPSLQETGTYFIGYSKKWSVTKMMLEQMIELDDKLLSFSTVISGQLFFIPSLKTLSDIAEGNI
ncbi:MAG: Dyp-type peroxidase [Lactobacillaceae bacterium]|jgi:putative iron-dependent peroxidase|nr:Dyp-type peroxidase [Lactobacillaceae bacterium]